MDTQPGRLVLYLDNVCLLPEPHGLGFWQRIRRMLCLICEYGTVSVECMTSTLDGALFVRSGLAASISCDGFDSSTRKSMCP